jgi:tetratricopeptide (TPR) repeat protein
MVTRRLVWGALFLCAAVMALSPPVLAQNRPDAAEIEDAFRKLLLDPGNIAAHTRYAELQGRAENFEAAISSLERMLVENSNQPELEVELGILYFRLGSYGMAQVYLDRALANPNLSAELRARAEQYRRDAAQRASPVRFAASLTTGLRYQTNANNGADDALIRALGLDILRPSQLRPRSDIDGFISGQFDYAYDLGRQNELSWVTSGSFFGNLHGRVHDLDLGLVEANTGLRFLPAPQIAPTLTLRPYVLAGFASTGGDPLFSSVGTGVEATTLFGKSLAGSLGYELRYRDYDRFRGVEFARKQSGLENAGRLRLGYVLAPGQLLTGQLDLRHDDAARGQFGYRDVELTGIYSLSYRPLIGALPNNWTLALSAGHLWRDYKAPDPAVDPARTRRERIWRVGAIQTVPIAEFWSLFGQVEQRWVDSNIANFRYTNTSVLIGVTRLF